MAQTPATENDDSGEIELLLTDLKMSAMEGNRAGARGWAWTWGSADRRERTDGLDALVHDRQAPVTRHQAARAVLLVNNP